VPDFENIQSETSSPLEPLVDSSDVPDGTVLLTEQKSLDRALVRGVAWTASVKWLTQVLTWGMTIVVARLLLPSDYGLVGMATIYINLFTLFSEFGIGTAVVTMQALTDEQTSQLNSLSVILGFVGFLFSAAAAVPLGKFYHAPHLPNVVLILSIGFIVSGFRIVPYALLQKELRFKLLAVIEGVQGVVQASLTLLLAFLGFGYWALAVGILSFTITPTVLVLLLKRQAYTLPKLSSIRKSIHYSRRLLIARLASASYNDSDFVIAGKFLGEAALGAYTLAWSLAHTPLEKLTTLVNRVTPSVFAKVQTDSGALSRYLQNITGVMSLAIFPATIGMALVAPEFVPAVLGAKWNQTVIPLQLLAIHALMRSNVILLAPVLNVIGEEGLAMWTSIATMMALPISFYVGSRWGPVGIASGWVFVYPLLQIPLFSRSFSRIHLRLSDYLTTMWPALSACVVMASSIEVLRLACDRRPLYFRLSSEILGGIVSYSLVLLLLHRRYLHRILIFVKTHRSGTIVS
jgi:O-antigen/teichoic acid export membrane protein